MYIKVGEKNIVAPKMQNKYGAIKSFICYRNIGIFSIFSCKVIALNLLCFIFGIISLLLSFISFYMDTAL